MAQNKGYMAKIGLDTSDVDKKMRSLTSELRQIDRALKDNGDSAELNAQKYTVLQQQLAATQKKLQQLQQQEAAAKEALNNGQINDAEYRAYRREVENTTKALGDLEQQLEEIRGNSRPPVDPQSLANTAEALGELSDKANAAADAIANTVVNTLKAAGTALANVTQEATGLYGEYEQLVGGVKTLFGDDFTTVLENADEAFSTAGISANKYMETATSFAASLISSLKGDTAEAAKAVDTALIDMADNANKMGTSMESIQNAYQGFAKQNYTMLDNLKLGYGGTKKEMERLLDDAQKLTGIEYDISNLDDVINAIHEIQKNLGIMGATADEAETTITGSAAAMKAAWENLLTAMADPENTHDLEQMVKNFVDTAVISIDNMMPSIEAALLGMGDVIEKLAPVINERLPKLIDAIMPSIVTAVSSLTNIAVKTLMDNMPMIMNAVKQMMSEIWENTDGAAKALIGIIASAWATLKGIGIAADVAQLAAQLGNGGALMNAIQSVGTALTTDLVPVLGSAQTSILAIGEASMAILPAVAAATAAIAAAVVIANELDKAGNKLVEDSRHWNGFSDTMNDAVGRYAQLSNASAEEATKMAEGWADADKAMLKATKDNVAGLEKAFAEMEKLSDDEIDWDVYNSLHQQIEQGKRDIQSLENLVFQEEKLLDKKADAEEKAAAKAKTSATYEDFLRTQSDTREQSDENFAETLADVEKEWDVLYHYDKKSHDEYWENRRRYLETHKNNSEAWWKAWNETEKYYADKAAKDEKQRQDEAARQQRDEEKAERERIAKERADLEEYFSSLEDQKDDKGEKWLLDRQKEYLDTLDESSDLYKEYYDKWKNAKKDFDEKQLAAEKEAATTVIKKFRDIQNTMKKEMSDLTSEGKEAAQKLADEYARGQQSIMNAVNKPQKVTDVNGKDRLMFTDFHEKLRELKKYQQNLDKLGELGLSEQHMKDIFSMDLDTRMKYIEELLRMTDSNRQSYLRDYENYYAAAGQVSRQEAALSGAEADIMKDSIDTVFTDISDNSFIAGKQAKEQWLKGFTEAGGELGAQYAADLFGQPAPSQSAASDLPQNISINIAGQNVIKTTLLDFFKSLKNSGGVMDV